MARPIIEVSNFSKRYKLGQIGMTSVKDDLERLWFNMRRKKSSAAEKKESSDANEFWALRDISFEVNQGEVLGVIGKNGAGKSTLLKLLSRITEPTTGYAKMRGRVASLLEVGTGFHPDLTGRENVYLNGSMLGMKKHEIRRNFDAIVEFAEIGKFIDTPVKRYSSGMYVRLAFAVAAYLEPEILIVDEVLAVGDAAFQRKCIARMQEVSHGHGRTVLFVSHSMPSIKRLCDRCLLLSNGRSIGVKNVDDAIDIYTNSDSVAPFDIDVSDRKRDWGTEGREVRINKIKSTSSSGLRFKECFEVEIALTSRSDCDGVMVGIAFNTIEGQRILTLDSDSSGKTISLKKGENVVRMSVDHLPLHPAKYRVSASVAERGAFHDILDGFAVWEVTPGKDDWESDRHFGGCRFDPKTIVT